MTLFVYFNFYFYRATLFCDWKVKPYAFSYGSNHHHHHHGRSASDARSVVAPPCPRSTARLQRSPVGRVESFRSWSSHLFRGRLGGRRHVRSGGRLSDTLMWSWRAMFAGVTSSRATCLNTEMRRRDKRWNSEVRPVRCSTSSFRTQSYHRIPSRCLEHFCLAAIYRVTVT